MTDMVPDSLRGTATPLACSTSALYWPCEAHAKAHVSPDQTGQDGDSQCQVANIGKGLQEMYT